MNAAEKQKLQSERKFIIDVIRQYRDLPVLWDTRSLDYNNRAKKNTSYDILLLKYRQKYPQADRDDLKKRLNSLRTNFRKELTKVQECGSAYVPSCWYYNEMLFLTDLGAGDSDGSGGYEAVNEDDIETAAVNGVVVEEPPPPAPRVAEVYNFSSNPINHVTDHTYPYVKKDRFTYQKYQEQYAVYEAQKRARELARQKQIQRIIITKPRSLAQVEDEASSSAKRQRTEDDDYLSITRAWAVDLKSMDPMQRIFAKKAINEILFEGQLGTLTRDSVEINAWNQPNMPGRPTVDEFSSMDAENLICIPEDE